MLASSFLYAIALTGASGLVAPLSVAEPSQVANAVESCRKATSPGAVDSGRLSADGWQVAASASPTISAYRHDTSKAVIMTLAAPLNGSCLVRARLRDAAQVEAAASLIDQLVGKTGQGKPTDAAYRFWRKGREVVGMERFDDGPGSPPHVIQIAVGKLPPAPKESR